MARFFVLSATALVFLFASELASADNIGVGKPSSTDTAVTSEVTTNDNIGVGNESWYELLISWFSADAE